MLISDWSPDVCSSDLVAHCLQHARAPLAETEVAMDLQHLADLLADLHDRVEGGHRLLEDHRHLLAAQPPEAMRRLLQHVGALQQHLAGNGLQRPRRVETHDGKSGDRLSRARLADHADKLARVYWK